MSKLTHYTGRFLRAGIQQCQNGTLSPVIIFRNLKDNNGKIAIPYAWTNYSKPFAELGRMYTGEPVQFTCYLMASKYPKTSHIMLPNGVTYGNTRDISRKKIYLPSHSADALTGLIAESNPPRYKKLYGSKLKHYINQFTQWEPADYPEVFNQ